jgi:hypothetical protein
MQEGLSLARSRAAYRIFLDQLTSLCAYAGIPSGLLSLSVALAVALLTGGFAVVFALGIDSLRSFRSRLSRSI